MKESVQTRSSFEGTFNPKKSSTRNNRSYSPFQQTVSPFDSFDRNHWSKKEDAMFDAEERLVFKCLPETLDFKEENTVKNWV